MNKSIIDVDSESRRRLFATQETETAVKRLAVDRALLALGAPAPTAYNKRSYLKNSI